VPVLRCRNATQTSVVLEWDPVRLATADLLSLSLFRNGQKAGTIPHPLRMHSTKISGLAVDTAYAFHLVLRTSAGTYTSERVDVRTHKMTDLSGITITTGILPAAARERLAAAVSRIGARLADSVRIDTTHFVTTEGRGLAWEKAVESNIPVVRPEWVEACEKNGRILGVTKFYLDALRPGPGEEAEVQAPPPPQQQQQQPEALASPQKELPPTPATPAVTAAPENGKEDESKKGESGSDDDDEEEDDEKEEEAHKSARLEEQKVRLEDKSEQKVALRPGGSKEAMVESEDEDDEAATSPPGNKPTSGDGSSFQDVAL
jgi:chitin biosynthesis protein CHS5